MDAVITCIYDEGALEDTPLIGAKGFSVMVERDGRRVLFDTGLRDRYLKHNLENLEIDPESIDAVVVSQTHPDNCRALNGFLDLREAPVDVYAPAGLYQGKPGFLSTGVGVSDENRAKMNLRDDEGWIELFPGITVTPTYSFGAGSERYLIVEGRRLNVISGRGIEGPARALEAVFERFGRYPDAFVGAILLEKKKKPVAEAYAEEFLSRNIGMVRLNHCVGRDGITGVRTKLGLHGVDEFYVGTVYKG